LSSTVKTVNNAWKIAKENHMKGQAVITLGVLSLFAMVVPAANADTYSTTTTSTEGLAPVTEVRTTTLESAPVTVVRETPVYIEPSHTTTIIEKKKHHHLISLPFVKVD
jgi:hypothetical protein